VSEQKDTRWLVPHLPDDPALLAALGRVSISHSFLDFVLRRTIKTLSGLTVEEGDRGLAYEGSASLRKMIRQIATRKFGKAATATLKVNAVLVTCKQVTKKRNKLMHALCARYDDEDTPHLFAHDSITPMPPAAEINQLADEIWALAHQMNNSRLEPGGLIYDALQASSGPAMIDQLKAD
jgi:hypothetical protein